MAAGREPKSNKPACRAASSSRAARFFGIPAVPGVARGHDDRQPELLALQLPASPQAGGAAGEPVDQAGAPGQAGMGGHAAGGEPGGDLLAAHLLHRGVQPSSQQHRPLAGRQHQRLLR